MPQQLGVPSRANAAPGAPRGQGTAYCRLSVNSASPGQEPVESARERSERASSPARLPCPLTCNNSTEHTPFPASAARTAYALKVNVEAAVAAWGLERTGFLTLTFSDHVLDPKEAQRRMNSLTTHALRPRYGGAIRVIERQKSGRIHYHLLVNVGVDIRTGFNFAAIKNHDYRTASPALRSEWAFWRRTAKKFGFGRTELLPVISTGAAVGRYVGKYISKHFSVREERDLGVRLVSYIGPRVATVKFAWAKGRGADWREGLGALVRDLAAMGQIDSASVDAMRRRFGSRWAWSWKEAIAGRAQTAARVRQQSAVDQVTGEIYECAKGESNEVERIGVTHGDAFGGESGNDLVQNADGGSEGHDQRDGVGYVSSMHTDGGTRERRESALSVARQDRPAGTVAMQSGRGIVGGSESPGGVVSL